VRKCIPGPAVILAFGLLTGSAAAGVPGDPTPELDDRPDTLAVKEVRRLIKRAVREEYTIDTSRGYRRDCDRRSRLRMRCRMRWLDDFGTRYRAMVEIRRSGTFGSPTDHYRVAADGQRNDAPGRRYRGTFVTETRKAYLGDSLTLAADLDEAVIRLRVDAPSDGVGHDEFDGPPAGTRYVGFPITLRNTGTRTYDGHLANDVKLVRADGTVLEAAVKVSPPCESQGVRVPAGQERRSCVVFALPRDAGVRHIEVNLDSGTSEETGQWGWR
jgi:hypothetical protein